MAFKLCNSSLRRTSWQALIFKSSRCMETTRHVHLLKRTREESKLQTCLMANKNKQSIHLSSILLKQNVVPFLLSDIGEGIVEVVVKEWFVKPGDKISQFDPICDVQSDKASVTITSRYDGIVGQIHYEIDAIAKVGKPLLDILVDENTNLDSEKPLDIDNDKRIQPVDLKPESDIFLTNKALATPAVRRIARENNVNLSTLAGTGKSGRILKEDILAWVEKGKTRDTVKESVKSRGPMQEISKQENDGRDTVETITGFRRAMAKSMTNAWSVPHFSYCDEVDATELISSKPVIKSLSASSGVKITLMPFFIKSASLALKKYPILNCLVDEKCEFLTLKGSHNIGVAIDTPNGLVVPNIKNVQELGIVEIARELLRLQDLGSKGELGVSDLSGGTFTLSNVGSIGGTYTKPIIFTPQVVIGALGKIQVLPRFDVSNNVRKAHIFNISWTADHRVIDGATLAKFSNLWKLYVETPRLLLSL